MEIVEVKTISQIRKFVRFPHKLFRNDPKYVPALDSDEVETLTKSPVLLNDCSMKMWLAYKDSSIVGRIACIINRRYNQLYNLKRARFGWWDTVEDYEVAEALFHRAEQWALSEGMTEIHGPVGLNNMGRQGLVIYGFDKDPQATNLYNPPYYVEFVERYGFTKELDWVQYGLNASQGAPDKLKRISSMLMERHKLRFVDIKSLKLDSPVVGDFFVKFNEAFSNVPNFVPFSDAEIKKMAKFYIGVLKPELSCIVVDENNEIACFAVCIPSLTEAFRKARGKIFPLGWYYIARAFRKYDTIDLMLVGSADKWNSKGVSAIYHTYLAQSFMDNRIKLAITNPQIETNNAVNVWDRYDDKILYIKRRCYIKNLI